MDSLENPLEKGKYYRVGHIPRAQYIGKSDDGSRFNFEHRNWANKNLKRVAIKTHEDLQGNNAPVLLNNEESYDESGYNTDNEWGKDPLDGQNPSNYNNNYDEYDDSDEELNLGNEDLNIVGGKRSRKKTRRHRKKTRKQRRKTRKQRIKTRKHIKKSTKHRKR